MGTFEEASDGGRLPRHLDTEDYVFAMGVRSVCHPDPTDDIPDDHQCQLRVEMAIDQSVNPHALLEILVETAKGVGEHFGIPVVGGSVDPSQN